MTQAVVTQVQFGNLERVLVGGDLSRLNEVERVQYVQQLCVSLGLNPLTKPFEYITLQGKLTLYAKKDATEQLRKIHKVSITIKSREQVGDIFIVTAQAKMPDGREDESVGAVTTAGLKGDNLANAYMKCESKAKRRVTLSICGLGILDESELDTIPARQKGDASLPSMAAAISQANADAEEMARENGTDQSQGYRIPFGKFRLRSLEEVGPRDLASYIDYLEKARDKTGKPFTSQVQEFIDMASAYIAAFENGEMAT